MADFLILAILPGQILGRFGNYFNQELFGRPTDGWWGIYISPEKRPIGFENFSGFHPTFIYESFLNLFLFIFLFLLLRKLYRSEKLEKVGAGLIFYFYLFGYSAIRFLMESFRIDYSPVFFEVRVGGWLAVFLLIFSGVYNRKIYKNKKNMGNKKV